MAFPSGVALGMGVAPELLAAFDRTRKLVRCVFLVRRRGAVVA